MCEHVINTTSSIQYNCMNCNNFIVADDWALKIRYVTEIVVYIARHESHIWSKSQNMLHSVGFVENTNGYKTRIWLAQGLLH